MEPYRHKTVNSFTQRPKFTQIISYISIILQISTFYSCLMRRVTDFTTMICLHLIYPVTYCLLIIFATLSSCIDPSDPVVKDCKEAQSLGKRFITVNYAYCTACRSSCSLTSKHCNTCNRCVDNFDHHCIWINNCIGSKNYKHFVGMITMAAISMSMYLATAFYVQWLTLFPKDAQAIVAWVVTILTVILLSLDCYLIVLHIYLKIRNMSTLALIMERQREAAQENRKKTQEKQKQFENSSSSILPMESENIKVQKVNNLNENAENRTGGKLPPIKKKHSEVATSTSSLKPINAEMTK